MFITFKSSTEIFRYTGTIAEEWPLTQITTIQNLMNEF